MIVCGTAMMQEPGTRKRREKDEDIPARISAYCANASYICVLTEKNWWLNNLLKGK